MCLNNPHHAHEPFSHPNLVENATYLDHPRIRKLRKILENRRPARVDGQVVDLFSANLMVKVFGALRPLNQEQLLKMPITRMAAICMQLTQ